MWFKNLALNLDRSYARSGCYTIGQIKNMPSHLWSVPVTIIVIWRNKCHRSHWQYSDADGNKQNCGPHPLFLVIFRTFSKNFAHWFWNTYIRKWRFGDKKEKNRNLIAGCPPPPQPWHPVYQSVLVYQSVSMIETKLIEGWHAPAPALISSYQTFFLTSSVYFHSL